MKPKAEHFESINKINELLGRLRKQREEKTQIPNISDTGILVHRVEE